jgi:hypothetical protein
MFVYLISLLSPTAEIAAYLDPGSGSFIIQLLIGGFVGLLLIIRTFWSRIKAYVNNLLGKTPPVVEDLEEESLS